MNFLISRYGLSQVQITQFQHGISFSHLYQHTLTFWSVTLQPLGADQSTIPHMKGDMHSFHMRYNSMNCTKRLQRYGFWNFLIGPSLVYISVTSLPITLTELQKTFFIVFHGFSSSVRLTTRAQRFSQVSSLDSIGLSLLILLLFTSPFDGCGTVSIASLPSPPPDHDLLLRAPPSPHSALHSVSPPSRGITYPTARCASLSLPSSLPRYVGDEMSEGQGRPSA